MISNKLKVFRNRLVRETTIKTPEQLIKSQKYLLKLRDPFDLLDRSYLQFRCQRLLTGNAVMDNIAALLLCNWYIKKCLKKKIVRKNCVISEKPVAFYTDSLGELIVPDSLKIKYNIIYDKNYSDELLLPCDINFIKKILKRHRLSPFFNFKIICKMAYYRAIIEKFNPSAIIATSEYSFTSSILTEFCRQNHIKHINIMHGEKLFDLYSTFFEFDKFYVWDESYIDLFTKLRAKQGQYTIEIPKSLKLEITKYDTKYNFKFYLEIETKNKLNKLRQVVEKLEKSGKSVMLRPHPKYTNINLLLKFFNPNIIEDPNQISIEESIGESEFVVARFSTVLYQTERSGGNVIIDNVTNPKYFEMLKKLDYIMLNKSHRLLSDVCNEL